MFELARVRRAFDRAAAAYSTTAVLQHEISSRLVEALDVIRLEPVQILDAGCGTGEALRLLNARYRSATVTALDVSENMLAQTRQRAGWFNKPNCVCASMEALPFADNSFDLVFSSLALQWCNHHDAVFNEMHRIIKPGGLLLFSTFGPDTLMELRASFRAVDDALHVNTFTDMHDIGDEVLRQGFADPVMHAEHMVVEYASVNQLLQDLRDIGANTTDEGHRQGLLTPSAMKTLLQAYEGYRRDNILPATYEIIYGHAWKPLKTAGKPSDQVRVDFIR